MDQAVGHSPTRLLVEGDRCEILDPRVQLEVRVAKSGDHRLTQLEQTCSDTRFVVVWVNEQVDESVAADRDMPNGCAVDDGYPRLDPGFGQEPIVELLPHARSVWGFELAGKQLERVRLREAAVVIVLNCIGVSGGRRSNLECIHALILTPE